MPTLFKLIDDEFNKEFKEQQWTYSCLFPLFINRKKINKITITDHSWQKKGRQKITKELILDIVKEWLNKKTIKPSDYHGNKIIYVEERINYQEKKYKIVFWFENNDPNWLWIRNCHQQD